MHMSELPPRPDESNLSKLPQIPGFNPYIPEGFGQPGYHADNIGPQVIGAQIGLAVVMVFVVALRIYTRKYITRAFGWDDWTILAATVLVIALVVSHGYWVKDYGIGYHMVDQIQRFPGPNKLEETHILGFVASLFHCAAMFLIKLSILIFMYRLIAVGNPRTRNTLHAVTVFIVVFSVVWFFCLVFKCNPPNRFWKDKMYNESGKCNPQYVAHRILPAIAGVTDLMVWAIPIPSVLKLQLPQREKAGVLLLFLLGSGSFIASFVRAALYSENNVINDAGWSLAKISLLAALEALVGVICTSLYTLKPFLDRHSSFFGSLTGRSSGARSSGKEGGSGESPSDSTRNLQMRNGSSDGKSRVHVEKHENVTRDAEYEQKDIV